MGTLPTALSGQVPWAAVLASLQPARALMSIACLLQQPRGDAVLAGQVGGSPLHWGVLGCRAQAGRPTLPPCQEGQTLLAL